MILKLNNSNTLFLSFKFLENSARIDDLISIKVDQASLTLETKKQEKDPDFLS